MENLESDSLEIKSVLFVHFCAYGLYVYFHVVLLQKKIITKLLLASVKILTDSKKIPKAASEFFSWLSFSLIDRFSLVYVLAALVTVFGIAGGFGAIF